MKRIKERPILHNTEMVLAVLDERKTQTRRTKGLEVVNENPDQWRWINEAKRTVNRLWDSTKEENPNLLEVYYVFTHESSAPGSENKIEVKCPYGKPGDILWVRETWAPYFTEGFLYKASCLDTVQDKQKWKPSIHMPKAAARIWLEITDIRVERLQDISEEDSIKEGVLFDEIFIRYWNYIDEYWEDYYPDHVWDSCNQLPFPYPKNLFSAVDSFSSLWTSINGASTDLEKRKYSWDWNPWVWVISYKQTPKPGGAK